jgi:hypothetical protein
MCLHFILSAAALFTHNAVLPSLTRTASEVVSLFGMEGGTFENCTFNYLRGNMPSEDYLFNRWSDYPTNLIGSGGILYQRDDYENRPNKLTLKNCTFYFNSSSAGLLALYGGQKGSGKVTITPDYLLMDGNELYDSSGQRQHPLIWLYNSTGATADTFQFKANNSYNGTTLNNSTAFTNFLVNNGVMRLTGGALPKIVP